MCRVGFVSLPVPKGFTLRVVTLGQEPISHLCIELRGVNLVSMMEEHVGPEFVPRVGVVVAVFAV